jgi:hypothetical protein
VIRDWKGRAATVQWGYHCAAVIGEWTIVGDRGTPEAPRPVTWRLRGRLVQSFAFPLAQRPLEFVVAVANRPALRWPLLRVEVTGGVLAGELGARVED